MILVTGATGLNGGELVRLLSSRGVPVRALVRSATKGEALSSLPNVEIVEGDMARPETLSRPCGELTGRCSSRRQTRACSMCSRTSSMLPRKQASATS